MADFYKKTVRRLSFLADQGIAAEQNQEEGLLKAFLSNIKEIADHYHMEMVSCAEEADFSDIGILPGKCIDNRLLAELFPDRTFSAKKDPGQRKACGCVQSRDIGMTDSCLFRCRYCYATRSHDLAKRNYTEKHFPDSPSLLGRI
jgi:sulfatase maturation enzyme AslB (radical SAM superfamily)